MKKKIMSIIAAAAVIASGSPLCANASYTVVLTKQDHTDYTKLDYMSTETKDYYIYTGNDPNYTHHNGKVNFTRLAKFEKNLSDRVYFNVNENSADVTAMLDKIKLLLKGFVTENGDSVTVLWAGNDYSNDIKYGYYVKPVNENAESNKPLTITPNDARRIKEILEKDDFAADMLYSTDVCVPNNGTISLKDYILNTPRGQTDEEMKERNAEVQTKINKIMEENDISLEVKVSYDHVTVYPDDDTTFEEMLKVSEILYTNIDNLVVMATSDDTDSTVYGGIDLSNAVDGDSNCDEQMDMADAVLIMQALANPNKYGLDGTAENHLTKQGQFNADLNGDGLTVGDAQAIQRKLLGFEDNPTIPTTAQPRGFKNTDAAIEAIDKCDVNVYPEEYREDYRKMFERFKKDGFIYQVTENEAIKANIDRGVAMFPYARYEDIGVGYYVTFKEKNYHIMFYYADAGVLAETDGIAEYLKKRMGRSSDKTVKIQGKNVSLLFPENGQCYANAFIDENHYFDVIGAVSEDELIEFLNAFEYEKLYIEDYAVNVIHFGYYDEDYNKPLPSARIALKCDSFCPLGEKLTVDVAKGDGAFHPQDYDSDRIYEYSIYPSENFNSINDEKLIVNGENGSYKKEYVGEKMQVFDIDGKYTDYDAYNHEKAVIDFKNYEVGSSGCITFSFKAIFSNSSTSGMMQNMYFYVGEKGISISNIDVENAVENYQTVYGSAN